MVVGPWSLAVSCWSTPDVYLEADAAEPEDADETHEPMKHMTPNKFSSRNTLTHSQVDGTCDKQIAWVADGFPAGAQPRHRKPQRSIIATPHMRVLADHWPCHKARVQSCLDTVQRDGNAVIGYLWKLNHDAGAEVEDLADLRNWRRRKFHLRVENQGAHREAYLSYISDKANLDLKLKCTLRGASVYHSEGPLDLGRLSAEAKREIGFSAYLYDLAIHAHALSSELYGAVVPNQLFPLTVEWKDAQMIAHRLVLAASSEHLRERWARVIQVSRRPSC